MNTTAPHRLIVDARYCLTATGGETFLVALNARGRWQLWDVTGSAWILNDYATPGDCYFATLTAVEVAAGV
jgi:hypothetical protein